MKTANTMTDNRLKIAVQKSGRLADKSLAILNQCGLEFAVSKDKLFCYGKNAPVDVLLVRDDDIPEFLREGICDLGLVGDNVAQEYRLKLKDDKQAQNIRKLHGLGYGHCRLALALPVDAQYSSPADLEGKSIATSYPQLLGRFLSENKVNARIAVLSGSVEIAPRLGTAEFICDLVSTGSTLAANHLRECQTILESEASVYQRDLSDDLQKQELVERIMVRLESVQKVKESKYVMFHAPRNRLEEIKNILPSAEAPTVLPLGDNDEMVAVHTFCRENVFWEHLEQLKQAGASSILVLPVEKMMA